MSTKKQFLLLCPSPLRCADFRLKLFGSTPTILQRNTSNVLQCKLYKRIWISTLLMLFFKQCHCFSPISYTFNMVWTAQGRKSQRQQRNVGLANRQWSPTQMGWRGALVRNLPYIFTVLKVNPSLKSYTGEN